MKTGNRYFFFGLIIVIFCACNLRKKDSGVSRTFPKAGVIHERIVNSFDSTQHYTLYIPQAKDSLPKPCIIFFDPHGDGLLPVSMYKSLADKFGFILTGSLDSKNGMAPEAIDRVVMNLFQEVKRGLPVDSTRIYLAGFSGGARVATLTGLYKVPAKGVIACGAGLAGASSSPTYRIDYFGMAGLGDFNMNEMYELDYPLSQVGLRYVISIFPGIHEWPRQKYMQEAFQWFALNAIRDEKAPINSVFVNQLKDEMKHKALDQKKAGYYLSAKETLDKSLKFFGGITDTMDLSKERNSLLRDPAFIVQQNTRRRTMIDEESERKATMAALSEKEPGWWKDYLGKLNSGEEKRLKRLMDDSTAVTQPEWANLEAQNRDQRLLAFLRLLCYMNATAALTAENPDMSEKIVSIYRAADPANPEPFYLSAILSARKKDNSGALEMLERSIQLGFKDKARMTSQEEFATLRESTRFYDLMQTIKP